MSEKCHKCGKRINVDTEFHCDECGHDFCIDCIEDNDSHVCLIDDDASENVCEFIQECNELEICADCCNKKREGKADEKD
ncbi:MAG: hypothetical protein WCV67_03000 [Victivallaceae bacterium]